MVDTFTNSGVGKTPEAPGTPLVRSDERLGAPTVLRGIVVVTGEGEVVRIPATDDLWSKADPGDQVRWITNRMGGMRDVAID